VYSTIFKEVVSSAAEAELAALFYNGKEACPIRIALTEMKHPQPATIIITDNSTASGIANETMKQKRSKAVDMRFYWIRDRVRQGQFQIYWQKGETNKADYFTKHHSQQHHQDMRSLYFHKPNTNHNYCACLLDENDDANDNLIPETPMYAFHATAINEPTGSKGVLLPPSIRRHNFPEPTKDSLFHQQARLSIVIIIIIEITFINNLGTHQ